MRDSIGNPSDSLFFLHEKILAETLVGAGRNTPPDGVRDCGSSAASIAQIAEAATRFASRAQR